MLLRNHDSAVVTKGSTAVSVSGESVVAKRIAPGSRGSPVTPRVSAAPRSQSAPPKNVQGAPVASEMLASTQQKVTKHHRTKSGIASRDTYVSKRTQVVHIPKSAVAKRTMNTTNDLSLSLNSTSAGRISTWK